jgi:hypothetical protein
MVGFEVGLVFGFFFVLAVMSIADLAPPPAKPRKPDGMLDHIMRLPAPRG